MRRPSWIELITSTATVWLSIENTVPPPLCIFSRLKLPDVRINGIHYEMKSPTSSHLPVVDKNVKKALSQSTHIVFDSKRMKNAKDTQVLRELEKSIATRRKLKSLIFVDKRRAVHRLK